MKRLMIFFLVLGFGVGAYGYGFLTGAFQVFPHDYILAFKKAVVPSGSMLDSIIRYNVRGERDDRKLYDEPDAVFLEGNFVYPIIQNVPQLYPPIRNIKDISDQLDAMGLRTIPWDLYYGAYDKLEAGKIVEGHDPTTVTLDLGIENYKLTSHAYKIPAKDKTSDCAMLYMPGTGHNASTDILMGDPVYYKDSAAVASEYCDVYIYVRPLEDYRALHNGAFKARENYMYGDEILHGSNHTTVYLLEALGLAKALRRDYQHYGIVGLSLGGLTGFYLSLDAEPDFAVIASGWAVTNLEFTTAVISQILIENWHKVYSLPIIRESLSKTHTHFLFTYSLNEKSNYEYEAKSGKTCAFVAKIDPKKLECKLHHGGHQFDRDITEEFYRRVLAELREKI
jgi:hypothetical protein